MNDFQVYNRGSHPVVSGCYRTSAKAQSRFFLFSFDFIYKNWFLSMLTVNKSFLTAIQ